MSGKSSLLLQMVRHRNKVFSCAIDFVVWVYKYNQPEFDCLAATDSSVVFTNNLANVNKLIDGKKNCFVIFDDLMLNFKTSEGNAFITDWFIRKSSHTNTSVAVLLHNPFFPNLKTVMLNASCTILFRNNRERQQIYYISSQMFPTHTKFLVYCYLDAISLKQFGFILLDHSNQLVSERYTVRNFVLPFLGAKFYTFPSNTLPAMENNAQKQQFEELLVVPAELYKKLEEQGLLPPNEMSLGTCDEPESNATKENVDEPTMPLESSPIQEPESSSFVEQSVSEEQQESNSSGEDVIEYPLQSTDWKQFETLYNFEESNGSTK